MRLRFALLAILAAAALVCRRAASGVAPPLAEAARPSSLLAALSPGERFIRPNPSRGSAASADSADPGWEAMVEDLRQLATAHPGQVGVVVRDLRDGREWSFRGEDLFPSASLIKLPIMAGLFHRIREGRLHLNAKLTLKRRYRLGGSGTIKWSRDGTRFTVRELVERMITESDNTAMKMLVGEAGLRYLQRVFKDELGLVYTQIHPEGLKLTGGRVARENYTTPREMADLLERMYRRELVDPFSSELMLEIMKGVKSRTRLARRLPPGWRLAHKTGTLRRACHDAGIFYTPEGEYLVVVLSGRNRSYRSAKRMIARVGERTREYFGRNQVEVARR